MSGPCSEEEWGSLTECPGDSVGCEITEGIVVHSIVVHSIVVHSIV